MAGDIERYQQNAHLVAYGPVSHYLVAREQASKRLSWNVFLGFDGV
ncbi:hypothetical protein [Bradyrhizobium sp. UFLA06-06]